MRMPELKALARERRLRNYSRLRKAELIELIRNDHQPLQSWEPQRAPNRPPPPQISTWEPINDRLRSELEAGALGPPLRIPLMKRQLKHRRNKDSRLAKKFKSLEADIDNLKSQMDALKDKITRTSESANAKFKRKKIRSMKREADKIAEKLAKSKAKLESVEQRVPMDPIRGAPLKLHPPNKNKCTEVKIVELNKKIRRARHKKNKEQLIEALKTEARSAELNCKPEFRLIDGAFDGAYRRYRIDGRPRMDVETFFNRIG